VSALAAVLAEARVGGTAENIAARLGLAPDLVHSMIDQGVRLGLLGSAAAACGSCVVAVADVVRPACAGCPLAGR
jgi:hypothetical protein